MTKQNAKSASNGIQNLFDPQGYQNGFKTWASANERMTSIAVEAGTQSTDIASEAAKEALSNVRDLAQVRDELADYGKAYSDFVQKQMDLYMRTARAYADVTQNAAGETTDLASRTGKQIGNEAAANAEGAADKASSAAKKAA